MSALKYEETLEVWEVLDAAFETVIRRHVEAEHPVRGGWRNAEYVEACGNAAKTARARSARSAEPTATGRPSEPSAKGRPAAARTLQLTVRGQASASLRRRLLSSLGALAPKTPSRRRQAPFLRCERAWATQQHSDVSWSSPSFSTRARGQNIRAELGAFSRVFEITRLL